MSRTSLSAREDEKIKLEDRLRKELPSNVKFEWDSTGSLIISQDNKVLKLDYTNPPYPNCDEDIKKLLTKLKATFT